MNKPTREQLESLLLIDGREPDRKIGRIRIWEREDSVTAQYILSCGCECLLDAGGMTDESIFDLVTEKASSHKHN